MTSLDSRAVVSSDAASEGEENTHTPVVDGPRSEWAQILDQRTLEVLEHRRRLGVPRPRGWLVRRMLLLADVLALIAAFLCVELLFGPGAGHGNRAGLWGEIVLFALTIPGWIVVSKLYGLYERDEERADHSTVDDLVGVFHLITVGTWLLLVVAVTTGLAGLNIPRLATFWGLAVLLVTLARAGARAFSRRQLSYVQNTVIVGSGEIAKLIARKFRQHREYGINVIGFVDAKAPAGNGEQPALLGHPARLLEIVRALDVERVVFADFPRTRTDETLKLVRSLEEFNLQIDVVPDLYQLVGPGVSIHSVEGLALLGLPATRLSRSSLLLKRTADVAVSVSALTLLTPLLAVIAMMIKVDSRGPVFFRQLRVGCRGKMFTIYKFRTMVANADARKAEVAHLNKHAKDGGNSRMFKIADDPRVTSVGGFLRRYSLDELPQLVNVLRGDMSLVGPRPLILDEDQHVQEWARRRLNLKPGITGLWQVLGRDDIPFEEMVNLDYLYVTSWSLFVDLKLIIRTFPALIRSRSAY